MAVIYLKDTKSAMGTELIFCDVDGQISFETRLTEFIAPMDCCAGTVHLPDKYKIFATNGTAVTEVVRVKSKMMPTFEARELGTDSLLATVRKKFSFIKLPIEMTTPTGVCQIEGNVFKRNFQVRDTLGELIFTTQNEQLAWGKAVMIKFDDNVFSAHVIATMMLAIESAYYTGN